MNMPGTGENFEVWNETFAVLLDIISSGRDSNPNYAKELVDLDDSTDFEHDVCGWLDDYLDELEIRELYDELQKVCGKLLELFCWKEDRPSDIRFRIAASLAAQGKNQEALEFCEEWYKNEKDDIVSTTALIYARLGVKDLEGAESLVRKYISDDTICTDENDIVFNAASVLYKVNGNKKEEKRINKAIEKYEKELEAYYMGEDEEDFDFDLLDEELPFN